MPKILFFCLLTLSNQLHLFKKDVPKHQNPQQQGIAGYIYRLSGNQMPIPGKPAHRPKGFATTLFVYETTNLKDVQRVGNSPMYLSINKKLICTIQSDSTGYFYAALEPGSYSLFVKFNNLYYANSYDIQQNIFPVTVHKGLTTNIVFNMDAGAVY